MQESFETFSNIEKLGFGAANHFIEIAKSTINKNGIFKVALAGGNTPKTMYRFLAQPTFLSEIQWPKVEIFFGDERLVPKDHPLSNYKMAFESFLSVVPIPQNNIHPVPVEMAETAEKAAFYYEMELKKINESLLHFPVFDLIILGMGKDGHTASIFPNSPLISETKRWVSASYPPKHIEPGVWRVTLTIPVLQHAKNVLILISGREKENALQQILNNTKVPERLPIQFVRENKNNGNITWLLQRALLKS